MGSICFSRKEYFCKDCFLRFIRGKQRKLMMEDKFKVQYPQKGVESVSQNVMLALSMGSSSLVLFDILFNLLLEQTKTHRGRQGFHLKVVIVDESTLSDSDYSVRDKVEELKEAYGIDHNCPVDVSFKIVDPNQFILDSDQVGSILIDNDFQSYITGNNSEDTKKLTITEILDQTPNRSSREDILEMVIYQLLIRTCLVINCQTILFGHSMTKLADQVISLTVRGRASLIGKRLTDAVEIHNGSEIHIIHPLRDVLKSEVVHYSEMLQLERFNVMNQKKAADLLKSKVNKSMTVNELTRSYFDSIEGDYSEVVSTVVKIGTKLDQLRSTEHNKRCIVCDIQLSSDPKHWLENITVNEPAPVVTEADINNLRIYSETCLLEDDASKLVMNPGSEVDMCYACLTSLQDIRSAFRWPVARASKEQILDEFTIGDDI